MDSLQAFLKQLTMTFRLLFPLLLFTLTVACGNDQSAYAPEASVAEDLESAPGAMSTVKSSAGAGEGPLADISLPEQKAPGETPKIIYTAAARGRVNQLDTALARITRVVSKAGGYLGSQHRTNSNWEHTARLEIRLPAEALSPTLEFLTEITKEIDYQNLDSRDVTAEWLDLESRLQTKRDVRDRYVDILRNKATKVEDILNAEDKIRVITEEIEAKEGQLRYLRDQVALSTLTLELYETREYQDVGPVTTRSFGSELVAALGSGWRLIRELLLGLLSIWPLLIIGTIGVWAFRKWRRRKEGK